MAAGAEASNFLLHPGLAGQPGHEKIGNEVANLAQQIQFGWSWNVVFFIFALWILQRAGRPQKEPLDLPEESREPHGAGNEPAWA